MITEERTYRGVSYKSNDHENLSKNSVEHVYRGKRYQAPLKHEPSNSESKVELHYRGSVYKQRQSEASNR